MRYEDIQVLVLLTAALFILVTGFIIYFVVLYRNRQLKNKQEQEQLQAHYRQEILRAQIEMQDQTLNYISGEIHDNITQVLSFVKLTLALHGNIDENDRQSKVNESRDLIAQAINDLRDLSKSLSFDHISSFGLLKTMEIEIERIKKSGLLDVSFVVEGKPYALSSQRELVLFRIFQEALNNTLKHANAKHLKISLQYLNQLFNLTLEDDGDGFSNKPRSAKNGSGLRNIENRAGLIGAAAIIDSSPGKGCSIKVTL
ncbi:MAG: histidine kinase, partial [Bacteroidota bacterium]|nr:histidine kinase [Bacteroidota bacterium]